MPVPYKMELPDGTVATVELDSPPTEKDFVGYLRAAGIQSPVRPEAVDYFANQVPIGTRFNVVRGDKLEPVIAAKGEKGNRALPFVPFEQRPGLVNRLNQSWLSPEQRHELLDEYTSSYYMGLGVEQSAARSFLENAAESFKNTSTGQLLRGVQRNELPLTSNAAVAREQESKLRDIAIEKKRRQLLKQLKPGTPSYEQQQNLYQGQRIALGAGAGDITKASDKTLDDYQRLYERGLNTTQADLAINTFPALKEELRQAAYYDATESEGLAQNLAAGAGLVAGALPAPENLAGPSAEIAAGTKLLPAVVRGGLIGAGTNLALEPALQEAQIAAGDRAEGSVADVALSGAAGFALGGLFTAAGRLGVKGLGAIRDRFGGKTSVKLDMTPVEVAQAIEADKPQMTPEQRAQADTLQEDLAALQRDEARPTAEEGAKAEAATTQQVTPPQDIPAIPGVREKPVAEQAQLQTVGAIEQGKTPAQPKLAPATFLGVQETPKGPMELYNLTEDIPGRAKGSTVTRETLEERGFTLPDKQLPITQPTDAISQRTLAESDKPQYRDAAQGRLQTEPSRSDSLSQGREVAPQVEPPVSPPLPGDVTPSPGDGEMRLRQTIERALTGRRFSPEIKAQVRARPEIYMKPQALAEGKEVASAMTDEQLAESLTDEGLKVIADENGPLNGLMYAEMLRRAEEKGGAEVDALLTQIAEKGTTVGQILRQFAELKFATAKGMTRMLDNLLKKKGRAFTAEQSSTIEGLAAKDIEARNAMLQRRRELESDFNETTEKAYTDAERKADEANKRLVREYSSMVPREWADLFGSLLQGKLITPVSQLANVGGNLVWLPLRKIRSGLTNALDAIYTTGARGVERLRGKVPTKERVTAGSLLDFPSEAAAALRGAKQAGLELLTGPHEQGYGKLDVQRGFQPLRALVQGLTGKGLPAEKFDIIDQNGKVVLSNLNRQQVINDVRALGESHPGNTYEMVPRIALSDRAKKLTEALLGPDAEAMFRLLNLGDRPFRAQATQEAVNKIARLRKMTPTQKRMMEIAPTNTQRAEIQAAAEESIMAQDNPMSDWLSRGLDRDLPKALGKAIPGAEGAVKFLGRLITPYRRFPTNYVLTALDFALPEWSMAQSIYHGSKGNRKVSLEKLATAMMGYSIYAAADYLWDKGLVSEPASKDARTRSRQYEQMGPGRYNLSGLERLAKGEDPTWRTGDITIDYQRLGIPAVLLGIRSQKLANGEVKDEINPRAEQGALGKFAEDRLGTLTGTFGFAFDQSFLAGTSSFLEMLRNPDYADNWMTGMFNSVSALAIPNTVQAVARAQYEYVPELQGKTVADTMKNIWDYKFSPVARMFGQEPKDFLPKIDLFGQVIERTPPNVNPYLYNMLDLTKAKRDRKDLLKDQLYRLWNETHNAALYPTPPDPTITLSGVTKRLTPEDYVRLQQIVGTMRKDEATSLISDAVFADSTANERVADLADTYRRAGAAGRNEFEAQPGILEKYFPETFGEQPSEETPVLRATPKALVRREGAVPSSR